MSPQTLNSEAAYKAFIASEGLSLVHFGASWSSPSEELQKLLVELFTELSSKFQLAYIDAESVPEASLAANVEAVPAVVFFKNSKIVHRVDGFHPTDIRNAILTQSFTEAAKAPAKDLNTRLKELINHSRVTLFMKGLPDAPRCGFSRKIVEILKEHNVQFWAFDILSDEEVRQGLKVYSDWPTYPQVYLDGELLGGLDVIKEEFADPNFVAKLPKVAQ